MRSEEEDQYTDAPFDDEADSNPPSISSSMGRMPPSADESNTKQHQHYQSYHPTMQFPPGMYHQKHVVL
jgi:hypothetical protein